MHTPSMSFTFLMLGALLSAFASALPTLPPQSSTSHLGSSHRRSLDDIIAPQKAVVARSVPDPAMYNGGNAMLSCVRGTNLTLKGITLATMVFQAMQEATTHNQNATIPQHYRFLSNDKTQGIALDFIDGASIQYGDLVASLNFVRSIIDATTGVIITETLPDFSGGIFLKTWQQYIGKFTIATYTPE